MYITIANYKGGVGKTTTAVHLAAYLQALGPTLLIDGDPNRSATAWAKRGALPFTIADEAEGAYQARKFEHVVIDTEARPGKADLETLARGCDLLVVPSIPSGLDTHGLVLTIEALRQLAPDKYKVLLTRVPPPPETDGEQLRADLKKNRIPIFKAEIPRLKVFEKAAADGVPVNEVKSDRNAARAWEAYQSVGKEIINGRPTK